MPVRIEIHAIIDQIDGFLTLRTELSDLCKVRVESRQCGYRNRRLWYFQCPGIDPAACERLVRCLYIPDHADPFTGWGCRHCHHVQYRSSRRQRAASRRQHRAELSRLRAEFERLAKIYGVEE
jgi:hypothetical protein